MIMFLASFEALVHWSDEMLIFLLFLCSVSLAGLLSGRTVAGGLFSGHPGTDSGQSCQGSCTWIRYWSCMCALNQQLFTMFLPLLSPAIIPVVTKIDLPNAQPVETALSMGTTFNLDPDDVIMTSAKAKIGEWTDRNVLVVMRDG